MKFNFLGIVEKDGEIEPWHLFISPPFAPGADSAEAASLHSVCTIEYHREDQEEVMRIVAEVDQAYALVRDNMSDAADIAHGGWIDEGDKEGKLIVALCKIGLDAVSRKENDDAEMNAELGVEQ